MSLYKNELIKSMLEKLGEALYTHKHREQQAHNAVAAVEYLKSLGFLK